VFLFFLIKRNPRSRKTKSKSISLTYTRIPKNPKNALIIKAVIPYEIEINPKLKSNIPIKKVKSIFLFIS